MTHYTRDSRKNKHPKRLEQTIQLFETRHPSKKVCLKEKDLRSVRGRIARTWDEGFNVCFKEAIDKIDPERLSKLSGAKLFISAVDEAIRSTTDLWRWDPEKIEFMQRISGKSHV